MSSTLYPTSTSVSFQIDQTISLDRTKLLWFTIFTNIILIFGWGAFAIVLSNEANPDYAIILLIVIWVVLQIFSTFGLLRFNVGARNINIILLSIKLSALFLLTPSFLDTTALNSLLLMFSLFSLPIGIQIYALTFNSQTVNLFKKDGLYLENFSYKLSLIANKINSQQNIQLLKNNIINKNPSFLRKTKFIWFIIISNTIFLIVSSSIYILIFGRITNDSSSIFRIFSPFFFTSLLISTIGIFHFHNGARHLNIALLAILLSSFFIFGYNGL